MVHGLGLALRKTIAAASLLGLFSLGAAAQEDPPTRVARLNYINGNVSMEPAGVDEGVGGGAADSEDGRGGGQVGGHTQREDLLFGPHRTGVAGWEVFSKPIPAGEFR